MTTLIRHLYHFLGGVKFALILLTAVALNVIAGTLLESKTNSHLFAAHFTYHNPFFKALLWGFFINILFSAMRRFPFKGKHIPFLITHWGLLMILGGVLIKVSYGTQGTMVIAEGSGSEEILLPDSQAILIEKKSSPEKTTQMYIPLKRTWKGSLVTSLQNDPAPLFPEVQLHLKEYAPHCIQKWVTWIKGNQAHIFGLRPFSLVNEESLERLTSPLIAFKTHDPARAAQKIYRLHMEETPRPDPRIVIMQDDSEDVYVIAFGAHGEASMDSFSNKEPGSVVMYDEGFGGYAVQTVIPRRDPQDSLILETPLTRSWIKTEPGARLEDNTPLLTAEVVKGEKTEAVTLAYDRHASGLKWPIHCGEYLLRFQPDCKKLPYRIRVRQARQINYPHSNQPYSFECDIIASDLRSNAQTEKTLSMNHVHETWDGYRFYLASITPQDKGALKRVQIAVNHDPAKYWLTYPGAMILTLGIVLLFWMKPYSSR